MVPDVGIAYIDIPSRAPVFTSVTDRTTFFAQRGLKNGSGTAMAGWRGVWQVRKERAARAPNGLNLGQNRELASVQKKFASPRAAGRGRRAKRGGRGTRPRESARPSPSPSPRFAGRGNRIVPGRRNSWISRLGQTVRCSSSAGRCRTLTRRRGRRRPAARERHGSDPRRSANALKGLGFRSCNSRPAATARILWSMGFAWRQSATGARSLRFRRTPRASVVAADDPVGAHSALHGQQHGAG